MKLERVETHYKFSKKRNYKLITPCCNDLNSNGKFVNYEGYPDFYGYCHSCGKATLPPRIYLNEMGEEFYWNELSSSFEKNVLQSSYKPVIQTCHTTSSRCNTKYKIIDFQIVEKFNAYHIENYLLQYLRRKYSYQMVNKVKEMYYIGTNRKLWTVFWMINISGEAQKAKAVLYTPLGNRTKLFKVPYKNEDGYYSCLFGEHLLKDNFKPIILVESEKSAIVAAMVLPNYTWLAYGGKNGLTSDKLKVLQDKSITIIPDISNEAVQVMRNKQKDFERFNINASIFDMTSNLSDQQLRESGWYNGDIEDVFRSCL